VIVSPKGCRPVLVKPSIPDIIGDRLRPKSADIGNGPVLKPHSFAASVPAKKRDLEAAVNKY